MKAEQCCFDGITECNKGETCDKCIRDETAWTESWSQWLEAGSKNARSNEPAGAAS